MAIKKPAVNSTDLTTADVKAPFSMTGSSGGGTYKWLTVQPAVNHNGNLPSTGYAWFIGKGNPATSGQGRVAFGYLQWSGSTPSLTFTTNTAELNITGTYLDLDDQTGTAAKPKQKSNGGTTVDLNIGSGTVGSRLMNAIVQNPASGNPYLWTCHHVGVASNGTGTSADRSAIQWIRLEISGTSLINLTAGKIYDSLASGAYYYYFHPSIAVNSAGDAVIGFSGSNSNERIGAFYAGRLNTVTTFTKPVLLQAGRSFFGTSSWGHYSHTILDTSDGSFWMIQEYAFKDPGNSPYPWGTWIGKITKQ